VTSPLLIEHRRHHLRFSNQSLEITRLFFTNRTDPDRKVPQCVSLLLDPRYLPQVPLPGAMQLISPPPSFLFLDPPPSGIDFCRHALVPPSNSPRPPRLPPPSPPLLFPFLPHLWDFSWGGPYSHIYPRIEFYFFYPLSFFVSPPLMMIYYSFVSFRFSYSIHNPT